MRRTFGLMLSTGGRSLPDEGESRRSHTPIGSLRRGILFEIRQLTALLLRLYDGHHG